MSRTVTAHVRFAPDRSVQITVDGPHGPVDAGVTSRSTEIGPMAREAARVAFADDAVEVETRVDRPPWLREGMLVRLAESALDPAERPSSPYAQVMAFLPVGGVLVMHPESGAGVYAPEDLTTVRPESIPPRDLESIQRRSERPAGPWR